MYSQLTIASLAGLGGMLGWGLADFFAKKTIDKIGDIETLFWSQFIGIFPLLLLFLFNPVVPQLTNLGRWYLVFLGIYSGLSYIPTYKAFGKGKVSLLSPIFASYAVIVAILSAFLFGEVIPGGRVIAFVVVFIGVILINGDPRDIVSSLRDGVKGGVEKIQGLKEILLAVCLYSVWLVALDQFVSGKNWVPLLLVIRIFSAISLWIYAKIKGRSLVFKYKELWKFVILIGVFDVAAFGFVSYGFSATPYASVVAMLSGAFSLPTIVLARTFLKERSTRVQALGSFVVIVGIMLLSLL